MHSIFIFEQTKESLNDSFFTLFFEGGLMENSGSIYAFYISSCDFLSAGT